MNKVGVFYNSNKKATCINGLIHAYNEVQEAVGPATDVFNDYVVWSVYAIVLHGTATSPQIIQQNVFKMTPTTSLGAGEADPVLEIDGMNLTIKVFGNDAADPIVYQSHLEFDGFAMQN